MSYHNISFEADATINETASKKNISQERAKKIIRKVKQSLGMEKTHSEKESAKFEAHIQSRKIDDINLETTCEAQMLKQKELLKENLALKKRMRSLNIRS